MRGLEFFLDQLRDQANTYEQKVIADEFFHCAAHGVAIEASDAFMQADRLRVEGNNNARDFSQLTPPSEFTWMEGSPVQGGIARLPKKNGEWPECKLEIGDLVKPPGQMLGASIYTLDLRRIKKASDIGALDKDFYRDVLNEPARLRPINEVPDDECIVWYSNEEDEGDNVDEDRAKLVMNAAALIASFMANLKTNTGEVGGRQHPRDTAWESDPVVVEIRRCIFERDWSKLTDQARWAVLISGCYILPSAKAGGVVETVATMMFLDNEGSVIKGARFGAMKPALQNETPEQLDAFADQIEGCVFYTLTLLACKNVRLVNEPIRPRTPRVRGQRNEPRVEFHMLHVDPLKQTVRNMQSGEPLEQPDRRLHVCRGHFRDYRKGNGLFGKYHGLFFSPQHVRGNRKKGAIEKEYIIDNEE
jgi:hypothetical protein